MPVLGQPDQNASMASPDSSTSSLLTANERSRAEDLLKRAHANDPFDIGVFAIRMRNELAARTSRDLRA